MKSSKVLCCMFLLAILGVDLAQNLAKYKRWLSVHRTDHIEALRLCKSCIFNEHKTKDVQGQGPSNVSLSLFVCCFDVYRASLNHFLY